MITQASIEEVKNQIDIVDIISHYIEVKKMGATYKACCPFHDEKTPSFVVNQNKGFYHCFGCGASGDGITFVMEYEKLSYPEAIEKLAQMYNISLSYTQSTQKQSDTKIFEIMQRFYRQSLKSNVRQYLLDRGLREETIESFELGFAPSNFEIMSFMNANAINLQEACDYGILGVDNENNLKRYYARLTQRVIFPIRSAQNKIIGFGGRTLGDHQAKYINSPQTKVFNKSKVLYGYEKAKDSIFKLEEIIISEGYLDVIMLHQAGFTNAVATLGTSLTKEHLPLLSKGNPKVIVAYDGDKAGYSAAFRAATLLSLANKEGGVVFFEGGMDPADMVKEGKITELKNIFSNPVPFVPFVLNEIASKYDLHNPLKKDQCLKEELEYLKQLPIVIQEEYKDFLASLLRLPRQLIKTKKIHTNEAKQERNVESLGGDFYTLAEKIIIKSILEDNSLMDLALNYLKEEMFLSQKEAFRALIHNDLTHSLLVGILLDNKILSLPKEGLKKQIIMLLYRYYEGQKNALSNQTKMTLREKSYLLRKYQNYLEKLKKGELVIYESTSTF
ncbi:DNA primase [Helicobacter burdigaliensis]|uniref:DNA primase n=1 Tax=Helicobacter burdigaliensis TaxID=2315334 RepID=UPI000EF655CD|nr:DNA primase [Helicobacter burdigaliensis]